MMNINLRACSIKKKNQLLNMWQTSQALSILEVNKMLILQMINIFQDLLLDQVMSMLAKLSFIKLLNNKFKEIKYKLK